MPSSDRRHAQPELHTFYILNEIGIPISRVRKGTTLTVTYHRPDKLKETLYVRVRVISVNKRTGVIRGKTIATSPDRPVDVIMSLSEFDIRVDYR